MNDMIASVGLWTLPADIYPNYREAGETRARNELRNLRELGFLRKDSRGYQLCIPVNDARTLFAYKETPTQRQIIAAILQNGFVYAHQFLMNGHGDVTQFLRAARGLVDQGVIESKLSPAPKAPHINRRIYSFTERAKKNASN